MLVIRATGIFDKVRGLVCTMNQLVNCEVEMVRLVGAFLRLPMIALVPFVSFLKWQFSYQLLKKNVLSLSGYT